MGRRARRKGRLLADAWRDSSMLWRPASSATPHATGQGSGNQAGQPTVSPPSTLDRRHLMSATRSAILRASALGAVAILGIVVLSPVFTGAPRVAAQVLTTSPSGSSPGPQGITVAGSGIITV